MRPLLSAQKAENPEDGKAVAARAAQLDDGMGAVAAPAAAAQAVGAGPATAARSAATTSAALSSAVTNRILWAK